MSSSANTTSAAIIIIGDEILSGQTRDTNTSYLAAKLHGIGIKVQRVSVIPDKKDVIAREVSYFSKTYSIVLTSGGIGPTHDDITYEAIAQAFDDCLIYNDYLVRFVEEWFKTKDREKPCFKLAQIPGKAKLNFDVEGQNKFPIVSVGNVYVFPGIPELLQRGFETVGEHLFRQLSSGRFYNRECFVACRETEIAHLLNDLVKKYSEVAFGSYPKLKHSYYKTKITIEAESPELADRVYQEAACLLPVIKFDQTPPALAMEKIEKLKTESSEDDGNFLTSLSEAQKTIEDCFSRYKPEEVIVCFNGGKDCIVMLHLVHAYFRKNFPDGIKLKALYIKETDPFPEVEAFIKKTSSDYGLLTTTYAGPMKQALETLLKEQPEIKATVLGTRKLSVRFPVNFCFETPLSFKSIPPSKSTVFARLSIRSRMKTTSEERLKLARFSVKSLLLRFDMFLIWLFQFSS